MSKLSTSNHPHPPALTDTLHLDNVPANVTAACTPENELYLYLEGRTNRDMDERKLQVYPPLTAKAVAQNLHWPALEICVTYSVLLVKLNVTDNLRFSYKG